MLFALLIAASSGLMAQKFGHLNSGNILIQIPETHLADSLLKIYQDSLVEIGSVQAKQLEADYRAFAKEYQNGNVPPVQAQQKQDEFQKRQDALGEYQDTVIQLVGMKRQELIGPILERLQEIINQIGKEGNYTMIFDTSVYNTILFARNSDDLEDLVKAKLGIQ